MGLFNEKEKFVTKLTFTSWFYVTENLAKDVLTAYLPITYLDIK